MTKLLGMFGSLIAAVCVATVIAATVLIVFYGQSWKVNHERLTQAVAILQGKTPQSLLPPPPPKKTSEGEQPAYEQVLEAQGLKARDLDLREMTVRANKLQIQEELARLADEKKSLRAIREDFQARLDDMTSGAKAKGIEDVLETLQSLKPKQAKELLVMTLSKGDIDVVVKILTGMSESKRAKIIAEFKNATELDQIGEVLNRIRQGQPATGTLDDANKKLQSPKGQGT
jgi:hypothetical protein